MESDAGRRRGWASWIGGLGHLALQFLSKWGCEITFVERFEARRGASTRGASGDQFDRSHADEKDRGRAGFHHQHGERGAGLDGDPRHAGAERAAAFVGVPPKALEINAFDLIGQQKAISGSPLGSPATVAQMLEFCARHGIAPVTTYRRIWAKSATTRWNGCAGARRAAGIVLENDFEG